MPKKTKKPTEKDVLQLRPPVVVVLGHVDHGKTSILDYIRKAKVVEKESGGITQHIGAYEVEHNGKKITFIDTPGHEAFSAMRSRGVKVADIAILVIAAEEGLKPQTKEAVSHIKKAGVSMIVAFNKIDKPEAQVEKVKGQLAKEEVVVESLGGNVPSVNVSAKTGQGIDELLEIINLVAEMEELSYNPEASASGLIIESYLDPQRGPTATLLIREGILSKEDWITTSTTFGKIKILEDFQGSGINQAFVSRPVVVLGFSEPPEVGDKFLKIENPEEAESRIKTKERKRVQEGEVLNVQSGQKVLNLIIKADVRGSIEPIRESLYAVPQEQVLIRVLSIGVGEITDSDVRLAEASKAAILGFRVKVSQAASNLAQQKNVKIIKFDVIYELIQAARQLVNYLLEPEVVRRDIGEARVLAIFRKEKTRMIVGAKVLSGELKRGGRIDILRDGEEMGRGKLVQLQQDKKEVEKVTRGECGILFEGDTVIKEGDILKLYEQEKRKLEI